MTEIETTHGRIRGSRASRVEVYRGIPYGAPTGGADRFRPPRPAAGWAGTRAATAFAPVAPQCLQPTSGRQAILADLMHPGFGNPLEGLPYSEDCLTVNVWTPGRTGDLLPVIVWLHGGGYQDGAASNLYSQADRLAAHESVVVMSVNHRLGILGYTALADVADETFTGSGVAGILDLVLALEWVRDNAAQFGGDPGNVTIVGDSGGGFKVSTLLSMPIAGQLFHKAVSQSGPALSISSRDRGAREGQALLDAFELTARTADRLREIPLDVLLDHQLRLLQTPRSDPDRGGLSIQPAVDGDALPTTQLNPWNPGVPVLTGTTADENAFWLAMDEQNYTGEMTAGQAKTLLDGRTDGVDSGAYEIYADLYPQLPPNRILARIVSDVVFRRPAIELAHRVAANGAPSYTYIFGYETGVLGGLLGAFHGSDLPFTFGTVDRIPLAGSGAQRHLVQHTMGRVLASFARVGIPDTGDGQQWSAHQPDSPAGMWLDAVSRPLQAADFKGPDQLSGTRSELFD